MPLNLLFCEGTSKSPDMSIILAIVPNTCTPQPLGTKYGLEKKVLGARIINPSSAGLKDGDFHEEAFIPQQKPHDWIVKDNQQMVQIGWFWERKEIENYLIDPEVVKRALGSKAPPPDEYFEALQTAAKRIADYTAARTALSLSRVPCLPLKNIWGKRRGKYRWLFPEQLGEAECRTEISHIIKQYEQQQGIPKIEVLNKFDELLNTCRPNGFRFQHFLTFFAGKDLLYGMETALQKFGFASPIEFHIKIIKGIEESSEDIWTWLPEWQQLRKLILNFTVD